jgi:hypothetical protein
VTEGVGHAGATWPCRRRPTRLTNRQRSAQAVMHEAITSATLARAACALWRAKRRRVCRSPNASVTRRRPQRTQIIQICDLHRLHRRGRRPRIKAARRAFSPTSPITQRDGGIEMRTRQAAAPSCAPASETAQDCPTRRSRAQSPLDDPRWRPSPAPDRPGSPCTRPASRPSGNPSLSPGGIRAPRPGFSLIPLRHDPRPASY